MARYQLRPGVSEPVVQLGDHLVGVGVPGPGPEVGPVVLEDDWSNFRTWAGRPDADQVIAELEATGSLTPGLNWYLVNVPPESWVGPPLQLPPVQAPTMGVWSTGDPALTEIQMTDSAENVAGPWRYERLDGPGHWMQLDAPNQVNALLLDFLRLSALKAGNRALQ